MISKVPFIPVSSHSIKREWLLKINNIQTWRYLLQQWSQIITVLISSFCNSKKYIYSLNVHKSENNLGCCIFKQIHIHSVTLCKDKFQDCFLLPFTAVASYTSHCLDGCGTLCVWAIFISSPTVFVCDSFILYLPRSIKFHSLVPYPDTMYDQSHWWIFLTVKVL